MRKRHSAQGTDLLGAMPSRPGPCIEYHTSDEMHASHRKVSRGRVTMLEYSRFLLPMDQVCSNSPKQSSEASRSYA